MAGLKYDREKVILLCKEGWDCMAEVIGYEIDGRTYCPQHGELRAKEIEDEVRKALVEQAESEGEEVTQESIDEQVRIILEQRVKPISSDSAQSDLTCEICGREGHVGEPASSESEEIFLAKMRRLTEILNRLLKD
jgi:uncharacterized Zn finger protein (UPF0148 family)